MVDPLGDMCMWTKDDAEASVAVTCFDCRVSGLVGSGDLVLAGERQRRADSLLGL